MGDAEKFPSYKPADPGLVFLDSSFRPMGYNAEAIRVLGYPQSSTSNGVAPGFIERKVRGLLSPLGSPPQVLLRSTFQSGKRRYTVRLFSLKKGADCSSAPPEHALMLERRDRRPVDISSAVNLFRLTPRETEILGFLMQGMTSKEIANHLGVSPHTVKAFLRLVMRKMRVSTRTGIIGKIIELSA